LDFQHFNLDQNDDGTMILTWDRDFNPLGIDVQSRQNVRLWFEHQVRRLRRLKNIDWNTEFDHSNHGIPEYQWNALWGFVDANLLALELAGKSLHLPTSFSLSHSINSDTNTSLVTSPGFSHYAQL
jgi:hypothetical protein